jgi:DNA-binding transcriptional LysR family regulator
LQLRIRNSAQVERWVASGEVELGVIGDATDLSSSFAADPWLEDELIVLVPKQHSLARRGAAILPALATEPILAREEGSSTRRATEHFLSKLGLTLNPAMELGSTEAIREAVAAGLGIALVSKYAAGQNDPRIATARLDGAGWRRRLTIIRRADTPLGPAVTRFRNVLLEEHQPEDRFSHKRLLSKGA